MGGGDAKLLAATSLWFGFSMDLMVYLLVSSMFGGILTLMILSFRASPVAVFAGQVEFLRRIGRFQRKNTLWNRAWPRRSDRVSGLMDGCQWVIQRLA